MNQLNKARDFLMSYHPDARGKLLENNEGLPRDLISVMPIDLVLFLNADDELKQDIVDIFIGSFEAIRSSDLKDCYDLSKESIFGLYEADENYDLPNYEYKDGRILISSSCYANMRLTSDIKLSNVYFFLPLTSFFESMLYYFFDPKYPGANGVIHVDNYYQGKFLIRSFSCQVEKCEYLFENNFLNEKKFEYIDGRPYSEVMWNSDSRYNFLVDNSVSVKENYTVFSVIKSKIKSILRRS